MTNPVNPYQPPRPEIPEAANAQVPVRVTGVLTPEDAISALRAVGKWQPWRLAMFVIPAALLAIGYLLLAPPAGQVRWPVVIEIAIFALVLALAPLNAKGKFVSTWKLRPDNSQPISWTFSNDGLFVEAVHSKHLHGWPSFLYARITADQYILAQQGRRDV
jgi:hypothetical protein